MSRHSTLGGRLLTIALGTSCVAMALALLVDLLVSAWDFHQQHLADLQTQADLLGRMTSPALTFDDAALARDNLALFESRPRIRAAAIYDQAGALIADYRARVDPGTIPPRPGPLGAGLSGSRIEVFKPIHANGEALGTVYLQSDSALGAAVARGLGIALFAGALALFAAWWMIRRLVPLVSQPIAAMSSVARQVVDERDYSRRVLKASDDEVGTLVDAFNAMLDEVESRTERLRQSLEDVQREAGERRVAQQKVEELNTRLEARVIERTQELESANRELAAAKRVAEEANRAKSSFLATMSHEIRTPMNGVVGMVDVLLQSSLRADQVEMVNLIRDSGFGLLAIIDDILDFSKIEAGRMEVESTPLDLSDTVEGACAMLAHVALRRNVELCIFVDPRIPPRLLGDPLRLRQVVVNLANNAIKFSGGLERAGHVRVRAEFAGQDEGGVRTFLTVADNGIGMDPDTVGKLFTAFTQSDTSTTRRYGGSGLGLAISHRLVAMMGGSLAVRSAPDAGSTFTVSLTLPVAADDPRPASTRLPRIDGVPCLLVGSGGLVEDLAAYLLAAGARLSRAADPDEALSMASTAAEPPVVVMDAHGLPDLRADHPAVKALLQRARGMIAIRHQVRRQWIEPSLCYLELDCNVLTRRRLLASVAAMAGLAAQHDPEPSGQHARGRLAPTREGALREARLILVAEDNEFNQQVILRQLALLGYCADVAADGLEALARWESTPYALVLSDLHMPGIDGYELAARIRAHPSERRDVPIVALTANALKDEAERCRAAGMDRYLTKPVLLEELSAELAQWLPLPPLRPDPAAAAAGSALDTGAAEQYVGSDPAAIEAFLDAFVETAIAAGETIDHAWSRRDLDVLAGQAHSLKSAARMVGADGLADLCERVERSSRAGLVRQLPPLVAAIAAELALIREARIAR